MTIMNIRQNVSLKEHSSMRLGGEASYCADITSRDDLKQAIVWAYDNKQPVVMIGGGNNIIWRDEGFKGLLLVNKVMGYEAFNEDSENLYLTLGAGENWDSVVRRSVEAGASGIEALSLIPGTVGATPVQNVGAYGQDISQTLVSIEAYDISRGEFITIPTEDCKLSYRSSRFNTVDRGRFAIMGLTLHLIKNDPTPPFYPSLQAYLDEHGINRFTPAIIRSAVIDIRTSKLPDPAIVANNGSFFANPVIEKSQLSVLMEQCPSIPHWQQDDDRIKLSAAWLVAQAGFNDCHDSVTGMATWARQPLVIVNEHAKKTADLLVFKQKIVDAVKQRFDVILVQEPELLP